MAPCAYFMNLFKVARSIITGMGITLKYFLNHKKTLCTIQYPREKDLIPARHRGIHYLETEKCVMCWKCSDICPVDCIYIEGVRGADGPLQGGYRGQKATLSKFTVDYTVCIFCGLCEEPCPPKCIWLGPEFDYHSTDRTMMEKNLLTDEVYTEGDEVFVEWARGENDRLLEENKKKKEAEKAAKAAEKAAAAAAEAEKTTEEAPADAGEQGPDSEGEAAE
ncbi:MAG: 4Fe-4S binding protein [Planctomycetota bacterium]|nr:4Fe-4S binding protein [Planctomycetota bacterium]